MKVLMMVLFGALISSAALADRVVVQHNCVSNSAGMQVTVTEDLYRDARTNQLSSYLTYRYRGSKTNRPHGSAMCEKYYNSIETYPPTDEYGYRTSIRTVQLIIDYRSGSPRGKGSLTLQRSINNGSPAQQINDLVCMRRQVNLRSQQ